MSGETSPVRGPRRHPDRGAAGRANRPAGQDPAASRSDPRAARAQARGLQARDGHESGWTRHAEPAARRISTRSPLHARPVRLAGNRLRRRIRVSRTSSTRTADAASPSSAWCEEYLEAHPIDAARSFMVGDRDTDLEFARQLGIEGLRVRRGRVRRGDLARDRGTDSRHGAPRQDRAQDQGDRTSTVDVDLSREGPSRIATGLGFFDHMLEQIAKHGGFALELDCEGDLHIDEHHTVEDCALALGAALREALGDKRGIARYGFLLADGRGAEAQVALDLSGRPYFVWEGRFERERVGELPTELVPHFFRSLAETLGAALHITRARRERAPHDRVVLQGRRPEPAPGDPARRRRAAEHQGRPVSARDIVIVASGGANIASLQFALRAPRLAVARCPRTPHASGRRATSSSPAWAPRRTPWRACDTSGLDALIPDADPAGARHLPRHAAPARGIGGRRRPAASGIIPGARRRVSRKRRAGPFRTWAGTLSTMRAQLPAARAASATRDYAYFVHSYALPRRRGHRRELPLRRALQRLRRVAQFLRRAISSRALRRGVGARLLRNFLQIGAAPAMRDAPCA